MLNYMQYYGLDWIAMVITLFALLYIGNKNKIGFIIMMCGNTSWIVVGVKAESMAMIIANVFFFLMNFRAIVKWSHETG